MAGIGDIWSLATKLNILDGVCDERGYPPIVLHGYRIKKLVLYCISHDLFLLMIILILC